MKEIRTSNIEDREMHKRIRNRIGVDFNEYLRDEIRKKRAANRSPYSKEIYEYGEEWYRSGLAIDEAPEEYRNHSSFIDGYGRAKRLAKIEEEQNNKSSRSRG